ncbi:MAG: hypothetical protein IJK33_08735 [Clostridia bacterium]|nr:hypothetical protein [Clostridia bacterium]
MTLLENLWYGNIDPHETILTDSKRYKHLLSLMGRNRDELNETLNDKQQETLEKYDEAMNEMHSLAEVEAFSYGFRLGVRLMIEAGVTLAKETT